MEAAKNRLAKLAAHFVPSSSPSDLLKPGFEHTYHIHSLSPTYFLPRAAAIEPDAIAIYHKTANGRILRRSYQEAADRARGFAYFLRKKGYKRVGILATNTPAFLESIFGIGGAGAINVGKSARTLCTNAD